MLQDENNTEQALENIEVWILMKGIHFTKRERQVYDLLKKDYKQGQISRILNLSKQRISKIHERINQKIRKQMEMKE